MKRSALQASRKPWGSVRMGRATQRYATSAMKRTVMQRDGWTCSYCGSPVTMETGVADHRAPWRDGGKTVPDNLVACCLSCNHLKGNRTEAEFRALSPEVVDI